MPRQETLGRQHCSFLLDMQKRAGCAEEGGASHEPKKPHVGLEDHQAACLSTAPVPELYAFY